jgi:phenylacetate-coenzyme A ligase PaaK-like adenylate-forming protein
VEPHRCVDGNRERPSRAAQALQDQIKNLVGVRAHVSLCEADTIERSAGKAKRVIDLR